MKLNNYKHTPMKIRIGSDVYDYVDDVKWENSDSILSIGISGKQI